MKIVGFALLLAGAGYAAWKMREPEDPRPEVHCEAVLRHARLEALVHASGEVRARESVEIQTEIAGTITELLVREGQAVSRGDVLMRIEAAQAAADAASARSREAHARSEAESAQARIRAAEISRQTHQLRREAAQAELGSARAQLARAELQHRRGNALKSQGVLSEDDFEELEANLLVAQAEVEAAGARLAETASELEASAAALSESQAIHRAAQFRTEAAISEVQRLDNLLAKATLLAPIDGVVTHLFVEQGERAVPGIQSDPRATLLVLEDLSALDAEVLVDESDVVRLERDAEARVYVDALPGAPIAGKVLEIASSPLGIEESGIRAAPRAGAKSFRVRVRLADPPRILRPGFSVRVEIVTARIENALAVPLQALLARRAPDSEVERWGVFVQSGARVEFRPLELGATGGLLREVRAGLREGERVIVGPYRTLRGLAHGAEVREKDALAP
jgi:HlyD family secretion protein